MLLLFPPNFLKVAVFPRAGESNVTNRARLMIAIYRHRPVMTCLFLNSFI